MSRPISILFTHTASLVGGGNKVLLSLFAGLDRSRYRPISILPERGPMQAELGKIEVPSVVLDLRPGQGRIAMGVAAIRLARHIAKERVAIVHANDPFTYRVASIAAGMTRTPRVCHLHHPDQDSNSIAWAFKKPPHAVLTPTLFVKERVCEWFGAENASLVHVVGNPIDTEWFSPAQDIDAVRERLGISRNVPQITIIGALAPHKGHDCFLRAAREITRHYPQAQFNVVGSAQSGDRLWAEKMRELARELGIDKSVRFWGFVPNEVSRDLVAASDIFMLPTKLEGFGLVIAEALACGVPVVSSAIRPLDEIVVDGRSGFLVAPDDFGLFAQKACELLDTREMRQRFAALGREYVQARFGINAVISSVLGHYEGILQQREGAP
jgi:glycosyltransferase involved in cell wall biosynthesis